MMFFDSKIYAFCQSLYLGFLILGLLSVLDLKTANGAVDLAVYSGLTYYVSPEGNDSSVGDHPDQALATIQEAVYRAYPGDLIILLAGDYYEDIRTVRDGYADAPIVITGELDAVVRGGGDSRVIEVNHSHIHLQGFTINGLYDNSNEMGGYRDILLYVRGVNPYLGPTGIKISRMHFENAGGECLRLRYFVSYSEITFSSFIKCGVYDFQFGAGGKNGEAIYIGTSSKQWGDGKNPTADPDQTHNNYIAFNFMNTEGNECVEVKEGSVYNVIENNICTGQKDPDSAGINLRGDHNIVRSNKIHGSVGAGIRIGGHMIDGHQYGSENHVYGNDISNNNNGGIKLMVPDQYQICQNQLLNNARGAMVGSHGSSYDGSASCF